VSIVNTMNTNGYGGETSRKGLACPSSLLTAMIVHICGIQSAISLFIFT